MTDQDNVITADFSPNFRRFVADMIKQVGPTRAQEIMKLAFYNPSFTKAIVNGVFTGRFKVEQCQKSIAGNAGKD